MPLLGKISAVLTANTQDFTKKIGLAKGEINDFAKKVSGVQLNLNTRALDGTLTKLQKFQKTVQELRQLRANGVDLGIDPRRLEEQFRVFEDVGKPLTALKSKIEGLSNTLQAGLYPELGKIQTGFRNLYREIESGAATFDGSQARIRSLLTSLTSLTRATAAAQDIGNLSSRLGQENVGASFFQPRAKEALQKSLSLREQATQVPARFRGGAFADLADEAERNAQRIEEQAARILEIQLRIAREGENSGNVAARAQAQAGMDALTRQQEAINASFSRELRTARIKEVIAPEAVSGAEKAVTQFKQLSVELRDIDGARFESLIASVGRVVEKFNDAKASASSAKAAIESLAATRDVARIGQTLTSQADRVLEDQSAASSEAIRRAATLQRNQIYKDRSLTVTDRVSRAGLVNANEQAMLARESFNREVLGRVGSLASVAESTGSPELGRRAQELKASARELNSILKSAATSTDAAFKTQKLDEYNAKLYGLVKALDAFDASANRAAKAQRQFQQFLSMSGGRGEKLDPTLEGAASDFMVVRQLRGQYGRDNDRGRIAVAKELEKREERVQSLLKRRQQIEAASTNNETKRLAALKRNDELIKRQGAAALERVSAESGGQFPMRQVSAIATRARKSAGSLGLAGVATAQLAFQQALFAVDDFVSATGGAEYKLRAIGNNITQLGLLLGQSGLIPGLNATTGLFIGLAAVLGGQAFTSLSRWASGADEADSRLRTLNSSLSRQKSLVEELANAFRSLGDSVLRSAFSEAAREASELSEQLEKIIGKQAELRGERIASSDPTIQRERDRQSALGKRLESEKNPAVREALNREIDASKRREDEAAARAGGRTASRDDVRKAIERSLSGVAVAQLPPAADPASAGRREIEAARIRERAAQDAAQVSAGDAESQRRAIEGEIKRLAPIAINGDALGFGTSEAAKDAIAGLVSVLAQLETPLQAAADRLDISVVQSVSQISKTLSKGQRLIAVAFDDLSSSSALAAEMDRTASTLSMVRESANSANTAEEKAAFQQDIDALEAHSKRLLESAMAVAKFAAELDTFSQSVSSDVSSFQQRADEALRQDLVYGTSETADARKRAEEDLASARTAERQFQNARDSARERIEQQAINSNDPLFKRLREIDAQLAAPVEEIDPRTGINGGTEKERDRLRAERAMLQQQADEMVNNSPEVQAARTQRDILAARAESAAAAAEGRELAMTERQRSRRDMERNVRKVELAVADELENGGVEEARALLRDGRAALAQQAAPMLMQFGEEIMTSRLQGPSRQALNVADVSTAEGARELSRLLRGDDPSKDVNLEELRKQTDALNKLNGLMDRIEKKLDAA